MDSFAQQLGTALTLVVTQGAKLVALWLAFVGALSAVVKAAQGLVDFFRSAFPGISKADTAFGKLLNGIEFLTHIPLLNRLALAPSLPHAFATANWGKPRAAAVAAAHDLDPEKTKGFVPLWTMLVLWALTALVMVFAAPAKAQVVSMGPTIPITQVRLADPLTGKAQFGALAAGAGYQLSFNFFDRSLGGTTYSLMTIQGSAFGTIGSESGAALDRASVALSIGTLNGLVSLGFGIDAIQYFAGQSAISGKTGDLTGFLAGKVQRDNLFALLSVGFNFEIGPYVPPSGVPEAGQAAGLRRANTVYLSF